MSQSRLVRSYLPLITTVCVISLDIYWDAEGNENKTHGRKGAKMKVRKRQDRQKEVAVNVWSNPTSSNLHWLCALALRYSEDRKYSENIYVMLRDKIEESQSFPFVSGASYCLPFSCFSFFLCSNAARFAAVPFSHFTILAAILRTKSEMNILVVAVGCSIRPSAACCMSYLLTIAALYSKQLPKILLEYIRIISFPVVATAVCRQIISLLYCHLQISVDSLKLFSKGIFI